MINLVSHFSHDDSHHSEWLRQRKWFIKARDDKEQRKEIEDKLEENTGAYANAVIVATELEIQAFEAKLDQYETATVEALIENQKALDAVNVRIESLLSQAYVMEDGRRVFKTEDGSQVFDEHGQEISADELDYDLITNDKPSWEDYQKDIATRDELLVEKEKLHEYQDKLDETREQISEGDLSAEDLEELNAELLKDVPGAVEERVPGMDSPKSEPAVNPSDPVVQTKIAPQAGSLTM